MLTNLTIILVTFYSEKIIQQTLQSLINLPCPIIIIDNGSKDNTISIIKNNFQHINLITLPQNIGYARANNIALQQTKTKYALLLNPDAYISEADILLCLQIMQENSQIAIAGPVVYNAKIQNQASKSAKNMY